MLALIDEAVKAGARFRRACAVVGLPARTVQRWKAGVGDDLRCGPRSAPANRLTERERTKVIDIANSREFRDLSPKQIVPQLADKGTYVASESTFYRVLRAADLLHHRAPSAAPTPRPRPDHAATGPNQVWSWDITFLRSAVRGLFYRLYMIVDIWSRKIVGWEIHEEERSELAAALFLRASEEHGVEPAGLVFHADNGGPMKGSTMLATLQRLGVVASFSRPRVSDDNPYSEALFRTLKYRPGYPSKPFASLEEARAWVAGFVAWYNQEHLHSGIGFVTPADRHAGRDVAILAYRRDVYLRAAQRRPDRWSREPRRWERQAVVHLTPQREETSAAR